MPPRDDGTATGVIHDIGYQRYEGVRLGRGHVVRSTYVHSLRTAYGLGRSARAKILPMGLFALVCVIALILVVVSTRMPVRVIDYVGIAMTFSYPAAIFVAVAGPELVSRDLRNNLLSLYFSRPLRRTDYAVAKLAALATAVFVLFAGPMLIMFLGMAFSSKTGIAGVPPEAVKFLLGLLAAVIHSVLFAAIAVPLSALTGRRVFATGLVIAVFLLTDPISGLLAVTGSGAVTQLAGLFSPVNLPDGVDTWLFGEPGPIDIGHFGPLYGLVTLLVIGAGCSLSILRYRKAKA